MKLEIVNDAEICISCDVAVNERHYIYENNSQSTSYEINLKKNIVDIQLLKEDIWETKKTLNSFFLILYVLDLVFGNLSESNNLPFSINHRLKLTTTDLGSDRQIFLSNIVKVNHKSLKRWTRYSIFQCSLVSIFIFIIGLILSFIFNGWVKIAFLTGIAVLSIWIYKLVDKKRKKLLKVLQTFL